MKRGKWWGIQYDVASCLISLGLAIMPEKRLYDVMLKALKEEVVDMRQRSDLRLRGRGRFLA